MSRLLELPQRLAGPADLAATVAILVSTPADAGPMFRRRVDRIVLANHSGTNTPVTLYQNGTAVANEIVPGITIDGDSVLNLDGPYTMNPGDTIQGFAASAGRISATFYGVDFNG